MIETTDIVFENFQVEFKTRGQRVKALRSTDLTIKRNRVTGIVGETGCGKSVLALGLLGLLPGYAQVQGNINYGNINIQELSKRKRDKYLGRVFGYIPQNPSESLNPIRKIRKQIKESLELAYKSSEKIDHMSGELIELFGFSDVDRILNAYPFQLSGGMQQRILTAISISSNPQWIIADEPTKGLDREVQRDVVEVLRKVKQYGVDSMIVITHDIDIAKNFCDELIVMYSGEVVEMGNDIMENPIHPYTIGFLQSLPANGMKPMIGKAPSPTEEMKGCRFSNRCKHAAERCKSEKPGLYSVNGRKVRCFLYD